MPKKKQRKRTSYLTLDDLPLRKTPILIWGYGKNKRFVCRLYINAAGLAAYTGTTGNKPLGDWSWEKLVAQLAKK